MDSTSYPTIFRMPPYFKPVLAVGGGGRARQQCAAEMIERGLPAVLVDLDILRRMKVKRHTKVKGEVWVQVQLTLPDALLTKLEAEAAKLDVPVYLLGVAAIQAVIDGAA